VPAVSVPNDEIYERYLQRAIREINDLQRELGALADETHIPVLGSGHPLPDVFLLKHAPVASEIAEGVAFFGRAGDALIKSMERLRVDPTAVYGTNCLKFGTEERELAAGWLTRELHITQPKLVVVMGAEAVTFLEARDSSSRRTSSSERASGRSSLGKRRAAGMSVNSSSTPLAPMVASMAFRSASELATKGISYSLPASFS